MHALPNMCTTCTVPTQGFLFALVANFIFHLVPATQTVPGAEVSCNIYTLTFKGAHALALNVLDCEKTKDGYSDVGLYFIVSETEREGVGGHHYEGASSLCDEWECLTVWVGTTMRGRAHCAMSGSVSLLVGYHYEGASSLCDEWECLTVWVGITMSW